MKSKNADRFTSNSIYYHRLVGVDILENKINWPNTIQGLVNVASFIFCQGLTLYLKFFYGKVAQEKTETIPNLSYSSTAVARIIVLICNRNRIHKVYAELRQMFPCKDVEETYGTRKFLDQGLLIENIAIKFLQVGSVLWTFLPLAFSLTEFFETGIFQFKYPTYLWYPAGSFADSWPFYIWKYLQEVYSIFLQGIYVLCLDLSLFSVLQQLCMHFHIIHGNIVRIEPDGSKEVDKLLIKQIIYHQKVLRLVEEINTIFTPSLLINLLVSTTFLCFTGFQLLGDLSSIIVIRTLFLLAFELRYVAVTCFLGDKLIENSLKISEAIYEHKWYNGTPRYKRLVLMVLMRSQRSAGLKFAGISDVSLQTFQRVMSVTYQIFTVLRTA